MALGVFVHKLSDLGVEGVPVGRRHGSMWVFPLIDDLIPDSVELPGTIVRWEFPVITTSISRWEFAIDNRLVVKWLMGITNIMDKQSHGNGDKISFGMTSWPVTVDLLVV